MLLSREAKLVSTLSLLRYSLVCCMMTRELGVDKRRQHGIVYIYSILENVDVHRSDTFLSSLRGSLIFGTVMSIWKFWGACKISLPLLFYHERGEEKWGHVSLHFLLCVLLLLLIFG